MEAFYDDKYADMKGPSMLMTTDSSEYSGTVYTNPKVT